MDMDDFISIVRGFWDIIWVRAISIVVISLLAGKLVDWILCGLLRWCAHKSQTDLDDRLIERLHKPLTLSVLLYGLFHAVRQLSLGVYSEHLIVGLIQTLALIIWVVTGLGLIQILLEKFSNLTHKVVWLDNRTVPLFDNLAKLLIFGAGLYMLLVIWNLNVTPWLASAGVAGIAGLRLAQERGVISSRDTTLTLLTGTGLKDVRSAMRAAGQPASLPPSDDALEAHLKAAPIRIPAV